MSIVATLGARLAIEPSRLTATAIVSRAVVAGILGGLLAALFLLMVGEDSIEAAIAIEQGAARPETTAVDAVDIGRGVQIAGGAAAVILYGALTGIVFGTVLAAVRHRLGSTDDFRRSVLLAAVGFIAIVGIPAVAYPANPPAVGDPDTIAQRTIAYLTLVAAGLVLAVAGFAIHRRLARRLDHPSATIVTTLIAVAGAVGLIWLWPDSQNEVPVGFPADLIWSFRLESLAAQAIHWSTLGLVTGWLLTRNRDSVQPGSQYPST